MPFIQCDFFSETLMICTSVNVILPQPALGDSQAPTTRQRPSFPTLYLLHGLSDDHTAWARWTSIERYALAAGIAVVMPAVNRSFYANMHRGAKYWDFISEELPSFVEQIFPLSRDPQERFVSGLSMGGYGAFKLALNHPDRFAAAASLSGVLSLHDSLIHSEERLPERDNIFKDAEAYTGNENDLLHLLSQAAENKTPLPKLYQCCGTEDFLYEANQTFLKHARSQGIAIDYFEGPGEHEWGYWDAHIKRVIDWLPLYLND